MRGASAVTAQALIVAFAPGPLRAPVMISNPVGIAGLDGVDAALAVPLNVPDAAVAFACVAAPFVRFRHASGIEREQLKWFAYGGAWIIIVAVFGVFVDQVIGPRLDPAIVYLVISNLWPLSVVGLPIATAIAILRYRLYDIDLLINRTLVYGALTALLAAAYVGGIVLFQALLRPLTSGSEIAVTASTLAVIALFGPLRRRIQRGVDRRFYRRRYDAGATVDAFALRLRDSVDLDALTGELLTVVGDTVQPAHASVWLRERAR